MQQSLRQSLPSPTETMSDRKPEPVINGKSLSSLRVVDLRQELEKRGMSKSGNKNDLIDRLRTVSDGLRAAPISPMSHIMRTLS